MRRVAAPQRAKFDAERNGMRAGWRAPLRRATTTKIPNNTAQPAFKIKMYAPLLLLKIRSSTETPSEPRTADAASIWFDEASAANAREHNAMPMSTADDATDCN
jgi:hypothetical protein